MAKASARSKSAASRRLPRGRYALAPEQVLRDQRERLLEAVPGIVAERGYEATSVADIIKAAAVSRNAFYKNFSDKQDCFAVAHEAGHERLFEILTQPCEEGGTVEERVQRSLAAVLDALASEPGLARLLFVEAPSAGEGIALRYHEWLQRYGTLLRAAAPDLPPQSSPAPEVEGVIVGGIASRLGSEVLRGRGAKLRDLTAPFAEYVLAFYRPSEPGPKEGQVLAFEPEQEQASKLFETRRRQAGA
ncbi:MAG TPA: TetR/AcrR family transcriptional regulator [Solirubrobacterales bacterium]|jgi:AcrR family transcriptional regulator|nr:TetR/AcrR family transcriptional regulator [Solirubrobacterales bacterium]